MKEEDIKKLLERYYSGETTVEEEDILRDYFLNNDVTEDMTADKLMFTGMYGMLLMDDVADYNEMQKRLVNKIDVLEQNENKKSFSPILRYISAAAASVVIIIGISYTLSQGGKESVPDTFDNPQEALAETQKALQLFADAFNKGNANLKKAKSVTGKVESKLDNIIGLKK